MNQARTRIVLYGHCLYWPGFEYGDDTFECMDNFISFRID